MNTASATPLLPRVRPRFRVLVPISTEEIVTRVSRALSCPDCPIVGKAHAAFISLTVPADKQHYWSPRLTVTLEETPQGRVIRGVYGPRPKVWTMFVFFYFAIGLAAVFIGIIGSSNLALGQPAGILWFLPLLLLILASLYLVSRYGERLAQAQMRVLHEFVGKALDIRFADSH